METKNQFYEIVRTCMAYRCNHQTQFVHIHCIMVHAESENGSFAVIREKLIEFN